MGQAKSSVRITSQDRAILDMKLQRDKLRQYQKKLETIANREHEIAKEALSNGNKSKALVALRRKKYQESLISKTDQQLETLQNLVSSVEFSLIEKDILYGLSQGNSVLKEIHKEMNIESVEKLMSDTADGIAYQKEIDELLMSRMTTEEEDEVQRELSILQAEQSEQKSSQLNEEIPNTINLPNVPETDLPTENVIEEAEQIRSIETREAILA